MKHYDIDGACPFFASYVRECAEACATSDEGSGIYWLWLYCDCGRSCDVQGALVR